METYEEIYSRMKQKYEDEYGSGLDDSSDIGIKIRVLAGELYNLGCSLEWLKRQMFVETADGENLDRLAMQRGITRRPAVKATGYIRFSVDDSLNADIAIPRGSVVSTFGIDPVRVVTTEDAELSSGSRYIDVRAEAEEAGSRGNISDRTATIPVSVPIGIDSVTNVAVFAGGGDEEDDISLRARLSASYRNQPNSMNAAYYIALAESIEGIEKAGVLENYPTDNTVSVFVRGRNGTTTNAVLAEVTEYLERYRSVNVNLNVARAGIYPYNLTVTVKAKAGYTQQEVAEKVSEAFRSCLASIKMGGKLYLSNLGKYLLETGCIENYVFDDSMLNQAISGSQYFTPGREDITVTYE